MDYDGVDIVVSLDCYGNLVGIYTSGGRERVAFINQSDMEASRLTDAMRFSGMSMDEQNSVKDLVSTERRHYHISKEDGYGAELYKDIDDAMQYLQGNIEDADPRDNWCIYACVDDCEGVRGG